MSRSVSYRARRIVVLALAVLGFAVYLLQNPEAYQEVISADDTSFLTAEEIPFKAEQSKSDSLLAVDVLNNLAVKEKDRSQKYYRKLFYDNWGLTASGCNTREAILARDLADTSIKDCKVMSGILQDPYTGKEIHFTRGQETSSAVQIDHVVALSNAWSTGAFAFDESKRYEISQDPLNLLAVDGPANQEKSDQDAADWLPSNQGFQCQYVARQISVKYKYELWVTPAEKAKMLEVLSRCPNEPTLGLENL